MLLRILLLFLGGGLKVGSVLGVMGGDVTGLGSLVMSDASKMGGDVIGSGAEAGSMLSGALVIGRLGEIGSGEDVTGSGAEIGYLVKDCPAV